MDLPKMSKSDLCRYDSQGKRKLSKTLYIGSQKLGAKDKVHMSHDTYPLYTVKNRRN